MSFRHNRKRNSALVYELLVRHLSAQILEGDAAGHRGTLSIIQRYFRPGSVLDRERQLSEVVRSHRGVSLGMARGVLAEIQRHFGRIDPHQLDVQKSNLIKEINHTFGRDFFGRYRIPEYRFFASLHMFLHGGGKVLSEEVARLQLQEALISFMTHAAPSPVDRSGDREVDDLACAMAAKKFQERYGGSLNREQKALLEKFMLSSLSGNFERFHPFVQEERKRISDFLLRARVLKEVREDPLMVERLDEAQQRLGEASAGATLDGTVEDLMLYYKLCEELESDE